ncbi:uncharacterized protein LOC5567272 isoform X4 [Aedes aegypti]|uniref:Uncharacterized protein n=1 Tax=Aedes aegypti TaxID=7159 RepID=A0A6I8U6Z3_AEDAE|nr:uncharacterized protein LOC5567272 isoform X4 [Aedes aegypti]
MKADNRDGNSTATTVYRILQSPAPICMFYFAHPFGISSPAATTTASTSAKASIPSKAPKAEQSRKPVPLPAPKYERQPSRTEIVRQRADSRDEPTKQNCMAVRYDKPPPKTPAAAKSTAGNRAKLKKSKNSNNGGTPGKKTPVPNGGHRVSRTPLTVKPHAKTPKRPNAIELDKRLTPLTPWPSTIWNRDFLIPPLLQVLAKQHGRKIPDIEQILRTVRSAWNTPKSQRSLSQSQDSRDSSSSNWDLSSTCDSYYCDQGRRHRMGAGTYATVMGSGPGLFRRRYSVPEIIMRKHTLSQQKSYDEPPHDTNHNNIVLTNKNFYPSPSPKHHQQQQQQPQIQQKGGVGGPMTRSQSKASPILQRKHQPPQQSPVLVHRKSITRAGSSVESGCGSGEFNTLASTGSESNLAVLKRQPSSPGGISRSQKCSSVNGINSNGNNNNNYIVGHPVGISVGVSGLGGAGVPGVGGGGGDYSMRKSTLLRRMWSKEMRRYDRSGSWSPPLRRTPRRIYSIENILPPEGGLSGGGSVSSDGSCVTTTATSCKECAKLESQYNINARGGKLSANESPKRLRLTGSLNNINLQKGDSVEALSRTSTPNNRNQISSEGLVDDSASVISKSSKPEVSSTTGTINTPLIQRKKEVVHDRSKRNFIFMSANETVELDEADLTSSTSSIASQTFVRPAGRAGNTGTILEASEEGTLIDNDEHERERDDGDDGRSTILNAHDNESDISEFLKEEARASKDDYQDYREAAAERNCDTDADVHSRKRAEIIGHGAAPRSTAVKVREIGEGQFPLKKQIARKGSNASSSAVSVSADSTDSESVFVDGQDNFASDEKNLTKEEILKNEERLDEYISNLLVDNLNNLLDTKELITNGFANSDQKNNNQSIEEIKAKDQTDSDTLGAEVMKHKGTEKYIGGGGGVVCNSPPDSSSKLKQHQNTTDKDSEKENEDSMNNNRSDEGAKISINYVRKKKGLGEKQSNSNGFYLASRNGSRDSDGLPSEIDLNGKYYFPSYGIEADPSDHTDIASEPEVQIISKIGLGSVYRENANGRCTIVPRISALPRTESMEVQPSSNSAEEFDDLPENNGSDSDTPSLVDSLDEVEITPRRKPERRKSRATPSPAPVSTTPAAPTAESTTKSESTSSDKSPRHEKGEAFFVPIQDTTVIIDEHIVVADTMPLRLKERLNNRQRLMIWRKEQENLKKHRKAMRLIEQRKFYGEPAIQVISTIDRAISRKEYIPPAEKKRVFGQAPTFTPKTPKAKKKSNAMRTELGMLESYKIDARGNMQIQNAAAASTSTGSASSSKKVSKSPWGQAAERRQKSSSDAQSAPVSSKSSFQPTTATTTTSSKTPKKTPIDVRRKHVLKDVQQMTLYPHADLTPDIEGGPRRVYQKTEIQEGDKHIEILEIVECADSAPRRVPRVRSAGSRSGHNKSRIPVPIYRWGRYRRSAYSRENSPLSTSGSNPKVDRMIADLLIEALANPDDVGVKLIKSPEDLKDKSKRSPSNRKNIASNSSTPRRSANSGKYTQRFEVIPEERSSVSISSSNEELSSARKKHASPRRVSFDEHHKILNVDEFEPKTSKLSTKPAASPKQSPKPSPKKSATAPTATPSPKTSALKKGSTTSNAPTTTSRGKAAIQSDVVEEKGWIGFSTQHEDEATPVNGADDEDVHRSPVVVNGALEVNGHHHSNLTAKQHERRNIVKTIVTGNIARNSDSRVIRHDTQNHIVDHFHHHQSVNISVTPATLTSGSVVSVDHIRSTAATVGSNNSCNNDSMLMVGQSMRSNGNQLAITTYSNGCNRKLTSGEFSDESCFTDSLNVKPSPQIHEETMSRSRELAIPVQIEKEIMSAKHGGHNANELKSTAESVKEVNVDNPCDCSESLYPYHQIREENAWHVYETADCKVIQSKIEYYETSIHRTPLTDNNHQSLFGQLTDRSPGSLRSAILNATFDNHELVRHELKPDDRTNLTSSDTLDSHHIPASIAIRTPAISEEAPKTSETCSSCCFCNPELHKHNGNPSETCFYCQAKAQTPSKTFPAPPTPPNIQMSPVPPSPKTPIMELTPTPSLQEIPIPSNKTPQPQKPQDPSPPNPSKQTPKHVPVEPIPTHGISTASTSINGLYTETTKKTDHTHTKTKIKTSDTVSTKCSTTNEKIKRSYVPSTGDSEKLEEVSKKLTRKKSETTVLNRPKHVNSLNRASSVVHSVQKEVQNQLKTPIKIVPKTAKELSNRKERDKQITLNLPLESESPKKHSKSKTTLGFENVPKPSSKPPCASSQSYDETTSSSSTESSQNSSPFKKCAALPPAATRWKHNSERNLTQLTMQKITAASKWGNKWRKAARQHENDPSLAESTLSPIRRRPSASQALDELTGVSDSPVKVPTERTLNGASATTAATTTTAPSAAAMLAAPSIFSGITQCTTNQGWTVTVAGNYNPEMAPDVEMKLSFPKQGNASTGSQALASASNRRTSHPVGNPSGPETSHQSSAIAGNRKQYIEEAHHIPGRGYAGVQDDDSYGGVSRGTARAALPPSTGLNPKRTLSRSDGTGGKDYRLPNVGTANNVTGRQNAKKAIKTMECSVVASATTRTVANKYHMLSHQHQQQLHDQQSSYPSHHNYNPSSSSYHHQQQQSSPSIGATATATGGGIRGVGGSRPRATSIQSLHPSLQNGGGGKYPSSNTTHQPRYHDQPPSLDYGNNSYTNRRMSLESPHGGPGPVDHLSVMGNAIAPEHKPKVPTMSERDLTRRHHPCYTRNMPYFS